MNLRGALMSRNGDHIHLAKGDHFSLSEQHDIKNNFIMHIVVQNHDFKNHSVNADWNDGNSFYGRILS